MIRGHLELTCNLQQTGKGQEVKGHDTCYSVAWMSQTQEQHVLCSLPSGS